MEIWKDVRDMEGYKVSNYGRVLSLAKTTIRGRKYDKILSASKKDNGKSKTCGGYEWIKR